jgi:hypothetical protein
VALVGRFGLVEILLLLVFTEPRWPGDWWIVEQRKVIVRGSCVFPGGAPKATPVDCTWLVDPHLELVVRHPVAG